VEQLHLQDSGYRLIINGGKYQTVEQLHLHLVSGEQTE
jgi:diadenosine tetraphosphate (Ap4A) HIT family hydrolase